jgi:hypothetical protein
MLSWSRIKDDLYNGLALLRRGLLTVAVYSSQESDRVKFRYRLQGADRQLAEAYRGLGKYGLMKLQSGRTDFMNDKEWSRWIQEIESKRAELDDLSAERETFDREEQEGP